MRFLKNSNAIQAISMVARGGEKPLGHTSYKLRFTRFMG